MDLWRLLEILKYLPGIPSAKEIKTNGLVLGEMNMLLLKKIEELTLHIINQQKEINSQEQKIDNYELTIDNLSQQLAANSQGQEKKIEELTLYQIEMMKIIKQQQKEIEKLSVADQETKNP